MAYFYKSPHTAKQPKKFDKTQYQPLRADANFVLQTCLNRQSSQYKLKEETVLYRLIGVATVKLAT
jgi:hypothetical protein